MRDYQQLHLARWQAGSIEDWQAELRKQGYSEARIEHATKRAKYHNSKGVNLLAARELGLDDGEWHSSGQF
jgi:hypothetical protein